MAAESFEPGGSPLYARLAREVADDPVVAEIAGALEPPWNAPLLLFAGVHLLALGGERTRLARADGHGNRVRWLAA